MRAVVATPGPLTDGFKRFLALPAVFNSVGLANALSPPDNTSESKPKLQKSMPKTPVRGKRGKWKRPQRLRKSASKPSKGAHKVEAAPPELPVAPCQPGPSGVSFAPSVAGQTSPAAPEEAADDDLAWQRFATPAKTGKDPSRTELASRTELDELKRLFKNGNRQTTAWRRLLSSSPSAPHPERVITEVEMLLNDDLIQRARPQMRADKREQFLADVNKLVGQERVRAYLFLRVEAEKTCAAVFVSSPHDLNSYLITPNEVKQLGSRIFVTNVHLAYLREVQSPKGRLFNDDEVDVILTDMHTKPLQGPLHREDILPWTEHLPLQPMSLTENPTKVWDSFAEYGITLPPYFADKISPDVKIALFRFDDTRLINRVRDFMETFPTCEKLECPPECADLGDDQATLISAMRSCQDHSVMVEIRIIPESRKEKEADCYILEPANPRLVAVQRILNYPCASAADDQSCSLASPVEEQRPLEESCSLGAGGGASPESNADAAPWLRSSSLPP